MPMSDYLERLRKKVGHDLLVLPSAAVAIHDDQGRLLMCRHADKNIWVIPGGLIEPGEHPADAAVRETWEETGLLVEITSILGVFGGPELIIDYANGDQASYIATIFRGVVAGGTLKPDGVEILETRYLTRDEFTAIAHSRWMDTAPELLFQTSGTPHFKRATWKPST